MQYNYSEAQKMIKKLLTITLLTFPYISLALPLIINDSERTRSIPTIITEPHQSAVNCTNKNKCPVAFISAGYGIPHGDYSFISELLNENGYLSVSIRHELKTDPPLSVTGDLYKTRLENWQRGVKTLKVVKNRLEKQFSDYDFNNVLLVGHSNGGDISALLANEKATFVKQLVTLDHRRVPLPRSSEIKVLSIRASDFPADPGVLHSTIEKKRYGSCIIKIDDAKHNDMSDSGPSWLKERISNIITNHIKSHKCDTVNHQSSYK